MSPQMVSSSSLFRLQILIFMYCIKARTILVGIQVVVPDYHGAGVARMQFLEQLAHSLFLCRCPRVGGLTADVQTTLVAYTYRVFVVVLACYMAVRADHPFRSACLYRSVTTDDVVVADAELEAPFSVPRIYLCCRTCLVRAYRTAMNHYQCNSPHDCTNTVELMAVRTVITI